MTAAAEQLRAELDLVFDWRDELVGRMQRAQEIVETVGLSRDLHEALIAEAHFFSRVCRALAARVPGSLTAAAEQEDAA
jgi:hypothetical protein